MTSELFAAVEHRRWSGPDDGNVTFCDSLTEAVEAVDWSTKTALELSGRVKSYHIYRLEEVDDDELHEWAIRNPDGSLDPIFFHDYGKRRDCPADCQVVKRRLGTTDWIPAPKEGR